MSFIDLEYLTRIRKVFRTKEGSAVSMSLSYKWALLTISPLIPNQFPDLVNHHCLLRVIALDFFGLLSQFQGHGCHQCNQVSLLSLQRVHLQPICLLGEFPENISGTAVVQCHAHSSGDVLQPEVMVLEVGQLLPDSLERGL